jgi:hypothetical protein
MSMKIEKLFSAALRERTNRQNSTSRAGRSPRSWRWWKVFRIAHQGVRSTCPSAIRRSSTDPRPSPQKRAWPSTASYLSSRSRHPRGSRLVDRRARPPLTTDPSSDGEARRKRHEKTLLTLVTLREEYSFCGCGRSEAGTRKGRGRCCGPAPFFRLRRFG